MSKHTVLARQYRPQSFDALVGQEAVGQALRHALDAQQIHHAYLFTGTRGVGKTTIARIIAKCLNCERGVSATPCQTCPTCQSITDGNFMDLYEVDAASKTKVEDTRDLLNNAQYAPTQGRYKIFLIDEVHMLSNHSFNALLKTLEEPPSHLQFLLATTEPEKLPATIISRCIHFKLRPLTQDQLVGHLQSILNERGCTYEVNAVAEIAKAAQGSVRDALSLLDQALSYGTLNLAGVRDMLGLCDDVVVRQLLLAIERQDGRQCQDILHSLQQAGARYEHILQQIMHCLHRLSLLQCLADYPDVYQEQDLAESITKESVQLFYEIAMKSLTQFQLHPTPQIAFEMTILRMMAFQLSHPQEQSITVTVPSQMPISSATKASQVQTPPEQPALNHDTGSDSVICSAKPDSVDQEKNKKQSLTSKTDNFDWNLNYSNLNLRGKSRALAEHLSLDQQDIDKWVFSANKSFQSLFSTAVKQELTSEINRYCKKNVTIIVNFNSQEQSTPAKMQAYQEGKDKKMALDAMTQDDNIEAIMQQLDASLIKESVELVCSTKSKTGDK